jgi:hypothetical protein
MMTAWALLSSLLVADLPQEFIPPLDLTVALDAFRCEAVHDAEDATALLHVGQDNLRGVGSGAEGTLLPVFITLTWRRG